MILRGSPNQHEPAFFSGVKETFLFSVERLQEEVKGQAICQWTTLFYHYIHTGWNFFFVIKEFKVLNSTHWGRSWWGRSWRGRSCWGRSWRGRSWRGRSWRGRSWRGSEIKHSCEENGLRAVVPPSDWSNRFCGWMMEEVHYLLAFVETTQILLLYPPPTLPGLTQTPSLFQSHSSLCLIVYQISFDLVSRRSILSQRKGHCGWSRVSTD